VYREDFSIALQCVSIVHKSIYNIYVVNYCRRGFLFLFFFIVLIRPRAVPAAEVDENSPTTLMIIIIIHEAIEHAAASLWKLSYCRRRNSHVLLYFPSTEWREIKPLSADARVLLRLYETPSTYELWSRGKNTSLKFLRIIFVYSYFGS